MGELRTDAWTYARAVLHHWGQLLAGALMAGVGVGASATSFAVPAWVWWILAFAFFTVAQFRAYRDVRRRLDVVDAENEAQRVRERSLREDRAIEGMVFHPTQLLSPGQRPLVTDRHFVDCTLIGPCFIVFLMAISLDACDLNPQEGGLYEVQDGATVIGAIGFIRCTFERCRFDGSIAYMGPAYELDRLRALPRF